MGCLLKFSLFLCVSANNNLLVGQNGLDVVPCLAPFDLVPGRIRGPPGRHSNGSRRKGLRCPPYDRYRNPSNFGRLYNTEASIHLYNVYTHTTFIQPETVVQRLMYYTLPYNIYTQGRDMIAAQLKSIRSSIHKHDLTHLGRI